MVTFQTLDLSVTSFIVLLIIYLNSYSRIDKIFVQYKRYMSLVIVNMALIVIDILGWVFNGLPGNLNFIFNLVFNLLLYIIVPLAPSLWVLYVYYLVFRNEQKIQPLKRILVILFAANAVLSFISLSNGWFFSVDANNIYHRGPLIFVHIGYCGLLLLFSLIMVLAKHKQFQRRQLYSILLFYVPQVLGSIFQTLVYGVSYNWVGMTISLLIIYFNFQSHEINTDYLTGANNRMHLQEYISAKIKNSSESSTFGAIMIDIDNFKMINDQFGHTVGDEALKDAVQIFKDSVRKNDFIARFGGDEFLIIINMNVKAVLENTVKRIIGNTEKFNLQSPKQYDLHFSMGYDIYCAKSKMKSEEFLAYIDRLMYADKNSRSLS